MEIAVADAGSTAKVVLTGRLDITGAETVAVPLATLSGSKHGILVDMSGVTFVATIGLRQLVSAAKTIQHRGGSFALLNPIPAVAEVIATAGLNDILPIERDTGMVR